MARGAQKDAQQTYKQAQEVAGTAETNANQLYKQLFPAFEAEATNPQGFGREDLAAMNTAAQQSVGGATAGAVGEGDLEAARTRNAGGFQPALDEAVRSGERQLSTDALGVQEENARLKEAQRQAGLAGEAGLYGTNTGDMLNALGIENNSTNALTNAGNSGWFQNMVGLINAAGNAAKGAAALGAGV
jgi:hypothetical protein